MRIVHSYSLMRTGHHAVLMQIANNLHPALGVRLVDKVEDRQKIIVEPTNILLDVHENTKLQRNEELSIIVLRDAYNSYASFLKLINTPNFGPFYTFPFMTRWTEYAQEIVGETNLLPNKIVVLYNKWVTSAEYRLEILTAIAAALELTVNFHDTTLSDLTTWGGGSSFDGLQFVKQAHQMKVMERYKEYLKSASYHRSVNTPEVAKLNEKIFDFNPFRKVEKPRELNMQNFMDEFFGRG